MDIFPVEIWEHIFVYTDETSRISHRFVCPGWYAILKRFDPPCAPANYTTSVYRLGFNGLTKWALENGAPQLGNDILINILNVHLDAVDKIACKFVCRKWRLLLFDARPPKNYLVHLLQKEQFKIILWALDSVRAREDSNICSRAILFGRSDITIKAYRNGCPLDPDNTLCENIALTYNNSKGGINALKWAIQHGAQVTSTTFLYSTGEISDYLEKSGLLLTSQCPRTVYQINNNKQSVSPIWSNMQGID
jgi:hypothetical protein